MNRYLPNFRAALNAGRVRCSVSAVTPYDTTAC